MSTFKIIAHAGGVVVATGDASPEGAFASPPGSICTNNVTGDVYSKDSGIGNTGWVDMGPVGGSVPTSRTLTATAPITGGGDLSANRSFGFAGSDINSSGAVAQISGMGTTITGHLSATASLNFGLLTGLTTSDIDITVTGAAVGDNCYASPQADPGSGVVWSAYIKASNKVTVRVGALAGLTVNTVTWRADVWKH